MNTRHRTRRSLLRALATLLPLLPLLAGATATEQAAEPPAPPATQAWARLADSGYNWFPEHVQRADKDGDVLIFTHSVGSGICRRSTLVLMREPGGKHYTCLFSAHDINGKGTHLQVCGDRVRITRITWKNGRHETEWSATYPLNEEGAAQFRKDREEASAQRLKSGRLTDPFISSARADLEQSVFTGSEDASAVIRVGGPMPRNDQADGAYCYPLFQRHADTGVFDAFGENDRMILSDKPIAAISREGGALRVEAKDGSSCLLPTRTGKAQWLAEAPPFARVSVRIQEPLRKWYAFEVRLYAQEDGRDPVCIETENTTIGTEKDVCVCSLRLPWEKDGREVHLLCGHYLNDYPETTELPVLGYFSVPKGILEKCRPSEDGLRLRYSDGSEETLPYPAENWKARFDRQVRNDEDGVRYSAFWTAPDTLLWGRCEYGAVRRTHFHFPTADAVKGLYTGESIVHDNGASDEPEWSTTRTERCYRHPDGRWLMLGNGRSLAVYIPAEETEGASRRYTRAGTLYLPLGRPLRSIAPQGNGCTITYDDGGVQELPDLGR